MRRLIFFASLMGAMLAILSACEPEVITSDTFTPEFRLLTDNFHGGDDFVFRVYSNHSSVVISKYECEYGSDVVVPGRTYQVQDGYVEFRAQAVAVEETHRGRIRLTVKDPDTGASQEFQGTYTAYVAFDNYLDITNEAATGSKVNSYLPCVVDGDDFTFTVHSNLESLTLRDYVCEFPSSVLQKGKEYKFDNRGELTLKIPKVSVAEDRYETPLTFSLTFVDPVSGEEIVLTDEYVRLRKFTPSLTIVTKNVVDGDDFTYRLQSNRKKVNVTDLTTNPASDANDFGLQKPSSVEVNSDGIYEVTTYSITVSESHGGTLKLTVKDSEYTGRETTVSAAYTASVKAGPSNISVDATSFSVNMGESRTIEISTTDDKSDGKFSYKVLSATGELELPSKTDDIGTSLTLKGKKSGEVKLRIYATNRTSVYKDVTVFVRHRVAVVVNATIDHTNVDGSASWTQESQKIGGISFASKSYWFPDMPTSFNVSLCTWTGPDSFNTNSAVLDSYDFTTFPESYECKASFVIRANPGQVNDWNLQFNYEKPWNYGTEVSLAAVTLGGGRIASISGAPKYFREYNDRWFGRKSYTHEYPGNPNPVWTLFDLAPKNPSSWEYDRDHLELKYVVMAYKMMRNNAYEIGEFWWKPAIIQQYAYTVE